MLLNWTCRPPVFALKRLAIEPGNSSTNQVYSAPPSLITPPRKALLSASARILLVEDDRVLADGLMGVLGSVGLSVEVFASGEAADAELQRSPFDLLLLDIGLPDIDGFELLRRLRARSATLPVLLLTARDGISDRVHGLISVRTITSSSRSPSTSCWLACVHC